MFGRFRLLRTDSKSRPWMKNGFVILLQKFRDFCIMFCIVVWYILVYVVCTKTKLDLCMQAKVKRSRVRVTWYDTMMFKVETNYTSYGIWDLSSLLPCLNIIHFAVCVKESVERKWESSEQTLLPSKKNSFLKNLSNLMEVSKLRRLSKRAFSHDPSTFKENQESLEWVFVATSARWYLNVELEFVHDDTRNRETTSQVLVISRECRN